MLNSPLYSLTIPSGLQRFASSCSRPLIQTGLSPQYRYTAVVVFSIISSLLELFSKSSLSHVALSEIFYKILCYIRFVICPTFAEDVCLPSSFILSLTGRQIFKSQFSKLGNKGFRTVKLLSGLIVGNDAR